MFMSNVVTGGRRSVAIGLAVAIAITITVASFVKSELNTFC